MNQLFRDDLLGQRNELSMVDHLVVDVLGNRIYLVENLGILFYQIFKVNLHIASRHVLARALERWHLAPVVWLFVEH